MRKWLTGFKQYPRQLWVLIIGMTINVTGASFLWPLNTLYISEELGRSLTVAGIVLMFHFGVGIVGNLLGGHLYDRIGGKNTILIGVIQGTVCLTLLAFFNDWVLYVILMVLLGFSKGVIQPAIYAMAGGVWPDGGRRSFNAIYIAQNIGVSVGTALGGFVAGFSFTFVFLGNAFTFVIFLLIIWFGLHGVNRHAKQRAMNKERVDQEAAGSLRQVRLGMISLVILSMGFLGMWLTYVQWQTNLSVYMISDLLFSESQYALLWTLNGALIIMLQPVSAFVTQRIIPNVRHQLLFGAVFFIIAFLVLSQQEVYAGFVMGMILITIGEIFVWPGVPTAAHQLAPRGKEGFYQGFVNSFATAGRMFGPFIGGYLYDTFYSEVMLYGMAVIALCGLVAFAFYDWALRGKRQRLSSTDVQEQESM